MPEAAFDPRTTDATLPYRLQFERDRLNNHFLAGVIVGTVTTFVMLFAWELLTE